MNVRLYIKTNYVTISRISLFVIYFWFGFLKLLGLSPAEELIYSLINTLGLGDFAFISYFGIGLIECLLGIAILFRKFDKYVIPIFFLHMVFTFFPILMLTSNTWKSFGIPTLEGQYIFKNLAIGSLLINLNYKG